MRYLIILLALISFSCSSFEKGMRDKINPPPVIQSDANFNINVVGDSTKITVLVNVKRADKGLFSYGCTRKDGSIIKYEDQEIDNYIDNDIAHAIITTDCFHLLSIRLNAIKNLGEPNSRMSTMLWQLPLYKYIRQ